MNTKKMDSYHVGIKEMTARPNCSKEKDSIDELTWVNDPEWSHKCAKEILSTLGISYSALKMYDIVKVLLKYQK